jgi:hypothetical protein
VDPEPVFVHQSQMDAGGNQFTATENQNIFSIPALEFCNFLRYMTPGYFCIIPISFSRFACKTIFSCLFI